MYSYGQDTTLSSEYNEAKIWLYHQKNKEKVFEISRDIDYGFNKFLSKNPYIEHNLLFVLKSIYNTKIFELLLLSDSPELKYIAERLSEEKVIESILLAWLKESENHIVDYNIFLSFNIFLQNEVHYIIIDYKKKIEVWKAYNQLNASESVYNRLSNTSKGNTYIEDLISTESLIELHSELGDGKKILINFIPEEENPIIVINDKYIGKYYKIKDNGIHIPANKKCILKIIVNNQIVFEKIINEDKRSRKQREKSNQSIKIGNSPFTQEVKSDSINEIDRVEEIAEMVTIGDVIRINFDYYKWLNKK